MTLGGRCSPPAPGRRSLAVVLCVGNGDHAGFSLLHVVWAEPADTDGEPGRGEGMLRLGPSSSRLPPSPDIYTIGIIFSLLRLC